MRENVNNRSNRNTVLTHYITIICAVKHIFFVFFQSIKLQRKSFFFFFVRMIDFLDCGRSVLRNFFLFSIFSFYLSERLFHQKAWHQSSIVGRFFFFVSICTWDHLYFISKFPINHIYRNKFRPPTSAQNRLSFAIIYRCIKFIDEIAFYNILPPHQLPPSPHFNSGKRAIFHYYFLMMYEIYILYTRLPFNFVARHKRILRQSWSTD